MVIHLLLTGYVCIPSPFSLSNIKTPQVGGDGKIEKTLSFNDLHRLSFNLARYLKNQGVEVGDRVALIHAPSADFIVAFLACQVCFPPCFLKHSA